MKYRYLTNSYLVKNKELSIINGHGNTYENKRKYILLLCGSLVLSTGKLAAKSGMIIYLRFVFMR